MTTPPFHGRRTSFSASATLEAIAEALSAIKTEDRLTFKDIGRVLGKSEDQAAKYCEGTADMGLVSFAAGKREWNGRFTGALDRLCHDSRPAKDTDRGCESKVLRAALALSVALADDNQISPAEVRANLSTIENARDALGELLGKLGAKAVRS